MPSVICGRSIRTGPKDSCRLSSIGGSGARSGRRRVTATKNSRRAWAGHRRCRWPRDCSVISRAAGSENALLRVAIVGCGKIADSHAAEIQRIKGCEIVAVCDHEPLMARQLSERFGVKQYFGNLTELLSTARPDVVDITTPPQRHSDIEQKCI